MPETQELHKEWEWNYDEQAWYHKRCDVFIPGSDANQFCPLCGIRTPDCFTWRDLVEWIKFREFDRDEYLSSKQYPPDTFNLDLQVWRKETSRIAVFWVQGSSEGWYIHVEEIRQPSDGPQQIFRRLLIKVWDVERACEIANEITKYVHGLYPLKGVRNANAR